MSAPSDDAAGGAAEEESGVTVELSADEAAALFAVGEMLHAPSVAPSTSPSLHALLASTGAPVRLEADAVKGRRLVAARAVRAGEVLLEERALAWALSRSPGCDGVFSMSDASGAVVATLPPWAVVRTLRDSLTLAPEYALRAEEAYGVLAQLSALGGTAHDAWADAPPVPRGVRAAATGDDSVPPRAQLLQAVFQCNAFSASLPEEDSAWRRALLWPLLGRLQDAADRERLFDDPAPLSMLSALFVVGALFNHACEPNVEYTACSFAEGDDAPRVVFRALTDVAEGEELCHSYIDATIPVQERRKKLLLTYRFACRCALCEREEPTLVNGADALARHVPLGRGVEGLQSFFARGGAYPDEGVEHAEE
jgi:hypothetical protein